MPTVGRPCGTKAAAMLACKKHTMTRWTKNSDYGNFFCLSCPSTFLLPLTTWHCRQHTNGPFRRHAYIKCRRTTFWHLLINWKKKSLRYCWRQAGKLAKSEIRKIQHVLIRLVYLYMFLTSLTFKNSNQMMPLILYEEKKKGSENCSEVCPCEPKYIYQLSVVNTTSKTTFMIDILKC